MRNLGPPVHSDIRPRFPALGALQPRRLRAPRHLERHGGLDPLPAALVDRPAWALETDEPTKAASLPRRDRRPSTQGTFFHQPARRDGKPGRLSFDRVAAIYDEARGLAPRAMAPVLEVLLAHTQWQRM